MQKACASPQLIGCGVVFVAAIALSGHATAAVFDVTQNTWGTVGDVGSFAWAVDRANNQTGADIIRVAAGLEINVDAATPVSGGTSNWLAEFTESVDIQGNGAKLVGNPAYITTSGSIATKTNIVANPYNPAIRAGEVIQQAALSFARIGTSGSDNSTIRVSFTDLGADGLASVATLYEGSQLTVTGGSFENTVNYTDIDAAGRGIFEAFTGSTLNLNGISITRDYPFDSPIDAAPEAAIFFGSIQGQDSQLNMENSSINDSFGAGAVSWNGGTANIVSSIIADAGGLSIADGSTEQGVLNFVNSILYMTGGDDLSQTNRIQAITNGEANILSSSILYDALSTNDSCSNVSYSCNGMPLTAVAGGVMTVTSSAVVPLNAEFAFPGKDSYSEFTNGDLIAGAYSYIAATPTQDAAAVKSLFDNLDILTAGDTYPIIDAGAFQLFEQLPEGAYPLLSGVLVGVVPDAGVGGANQLINPIDGQPILVDVYGNPRVWRDGTRAIGAVQVPAPAVFSLGLLALIGLRLLFPLTRTK
jgi:hypothetical protein